MKHTKSFDEFDKTESLFEVNRPKRKIVSFPGKAKEDTYYIMPGYIESEDDSNNKISIQPGDIVKVTDVGIGGAGGMRFEHENQEFIVYYTDFDEFLEGDVKGDEVIHISPAKMQARLKKAKIKAFGEIPEDEALRRMHAVRGKIATKQYGI